MTVFKIRAEGVAWQEIDDDLIVLDERGSVYIRLVGSATRLWPLLVEGASIDQLSEALISSFGIADERASQDARAFVASLSQQRLLDET